VGDKVHSHNSNCIYSVAKSNGDSIEFSLSIAEQRAVGFIPAWSLASLHMVDPSFGWTVGVLGIGIDSSRYPQTPHI